MKNLTKYIAITVSMLFTIAATSGAAHAYDRVYVSVPSVVISLGGHHNYNDKYYYKNKSKKYYSGYKGKSYYNKGYSKGFKSTKSFKSNKSFKSTKSFKSNKGFKSRRSINTRSRSIRRF